MDRIPFFFFFFFPFPFFSLPARSTHSRTRPTSPFHFPISLTAWARMSTPPLPSPSSLFLLHHTRPPLTPYEDLQSRSFLSVFSRIQAHQHLFTPPQLFLAIPPTFMRIYIGTRNGPCTPSPPDLLSTTSPRPIKGRSVRLSSSSIYSHKSPLLSRSLFTEIPIFSFAGHAPLCRH